MKQPRARTMADLRPNATIDCMVCEQQKPQAGAIKFRSLHVCSECAAKVRAKQEKAKLTEKQPKPLQLAKILEDHYFYSDTNEAAAELRRLHAENEDFRATIDYLTRDNAEQIGDIWARKGQRDELLEALHLALEYWAHREQRYKNRSPVWVQKSREAIAKAGDAA